LLECAAAILERLGARVTLVDLATLPAAALLGRERDAAVDAALGAASSASLAVIATPVYRATYTGLLKVFFDLMRPDTLRGTVALAIATAASAEHALAIPLGIAPLVASVGAIVAPVGVFATDAEFQDRRPTAALEARLTQAVSDARVLAQALHHSPS
jgi:FMN reductase